MVDKFPNNKQTEIVSDPPIIWEDDFPNDGQIKCVEEMLENNKSLREIVSCTKGLEISDIKDLGTFRIKDLEMIVSYIKSRLTIALKKLSYGRRLDK
jgi:hypothetical protein